MDNGTRSAYNKNERKGNRRIRLRREWRANHKETLTAHLHRVKNYEIATAFVSMGGERESPIRAELQILQQQWGLPAPANFSAVMR